MIYIKNAHIKTMADKEYDNAALLIGDDGKIAAIGDVSAPADATVIDAEGRLVTPGCIDAHCHIGLSETAIRWEGSDINEKSDPVTPQLRAIDAINRLKEDGYTSIRLMCLVASPQGVKAVTEAHPDVDIYLASLDEGLNDKNYILPGLGDAGDRIFGTK